MCFLVAGAFNASPRDMGKVVFGSLGVVFLAFCGFVMQVRRIVVDPASREVRLTSQGFRRTTTERLRFDEIGKILVFMTYDSVDDSRGVARQRERWAIALILEERNVTLTKNLYITKDQALRDARKIQELLGVEISGDVGESIAHLARSGRKVEAIALARREHGMTLEQAKDFVERGGAR